MELKDILAQDTITLTDGNYLAAYTRHEGYTPSSIDNSQVHRGRYLYKIKGSNNGTEGDPQDFTIVPVVVSPDGKEHLEDTANPVVVQKGTTIHYTTGRNHPDYNDGYHSRADLHKVMEATEGQEERHVLLGFIEFADSEFSLGVNEFQVLPPEEVEAPA